MGEGRKKGRKAERAVKHLCFRMGPPAPRRFDLRMGGRQRRVALTCFFTATCFLTATLVLYSHLHSLSPLAHPATRLSRSLRLTTIVPATRSLRLGWAFILCDPARLHIVRGTMALLVKGGADHRTFHTFDMCAAHGPSHWSLPLVPRLNMHAPTNTLAAERAVPMPHRGSSSHSSARQRVVDMVNMRQATAWNRKTVT